MNSRDLARYLVLGGVIAGLSAGTNLRADTAKSNTLSFNQSTSQAEPMAKKAKVAVDKHACKGLNSCKSHGNCKTGDAGCAGKNSCKGKGGCASADMKHSCKGMNSCKGQGGCKTGDASCAGKNSCKGKGGCAVPVKKAA